MPRECDMKKCGALILLACAFAPLTPEPVGASPVTWDFIATSCSNDPFGCDPSQHYPLVLAALTLDGPASSGVAQYGGPNLGDPFAFRSRRLAVPRAIDGLERRADGSALWFSAHLLGDRLPALMDRD